MTGKPIMRISAADLDNLMTTLDVTFLKLAECIVSPGWRLAMPASDAPGVHYNLQGWGRIVVGEHAPIELRPHTLVIVPPGNKFQFEVVGEQGTDATSKTVAVEAQAFLSSTPRRLVAGTGEPKIVLICGYFRAVYGASVNLFAALGKPIVEQFDADDELDHKFTSALAELLAQEVGVGAMTATLMKQVLVVLLRRSLQSVDLWSERFSILSDAHIARAFAIMVAQPGSAHSVHSLAQCACLSRSAFMARFSALFGQAPMVILRELRMRQARLLLASDMPVDQVALAVGYAGRSSFLRAYRKANGSSPSESRRGAGPAIADSATTHT